MEFRGQVTPQLGEIAFLLLANVRIVCNLWSSYRANGLGASDPLLSPHPLYLQLGASPASRQAAYRDLFRTELDEAALSELRLAIQQSH